MENALLVNQLILPGHIGRQRNPLSKYKFALLSEGQQKIRRVLMTEERTLGQSYLKMAQSELCCVLSASRISRRWPITPDAEHAGATG